MIVFSFAITVYRDKRKEVLMDFTYLLKEKSMSIYECSKRSGIPYSTLSDIIKGETLIEKVSARNLNSLASTLEYSMDALYSRLHVPERHDFELFKSATCHRVKEKGDIKFITDVLQDNDIRKFFSWEWYPESLYTLAMTDYLSNENGIALCSDYDDIRATRLEEPVFPSSVLAMCAATGNDKSKEDALRKAIPEFLKYNIVESEVRNVV